MFTSIEDTGSYEPSAVGYKERVQDEFTIGDVIRKARQLRRWNQTRLGQEAAKYAIRRTGGPINKSTVSKVETDPYSSEFGTVWRLIAAVGLTLGDVERRVDAPFLSVEEMRAAARDAERQIQASSPARKRVRKVSR
jgi:hypothetical protein